MDGSTLGESLVTEGGDEKGTSNDRLNVNGNGILEVYPLVELLSADDRSEIGSSNGTADENRECKFEGSPLEELTFGLEARIEAGSYVGKLEGSPLGEALDS